MQNSRLFTADELQKKGVLLAPVAADAGAGEELGSSEFLVFDRVFEAVLHEHWEKRRIRVLNRARSLQSLPPADVEAWRLSLAQDRPVPDEDLLDRIEDTYDSGEYLIVSGRLLTNQVSCGQREPLPSYNARNPALPMAYCQRLLKLQFQIYDRMKKEKVWSGLIYASDETSEKIPKGSKAPKEMPRPPAIELLMREAFKNFANLMAGTLESKH